MADALDALGLPVEPIDPDPAFAARLRHQLQDALLTTTTSRGGTAMTEFQLHETDEFVATDVGDYVAWPPALTPYISVRGARRAIDWNTEVFAARLRGGLYEGPDGSIGHAELAIGDAVLMLSDPWPEGGVDAPELGHTHSHSLHLQVDDVDSTVRRAAEEGAVIEGPNSDTPMCFGVLIGRAGARAVPAGIVVFECSRGASCADLHMQHASPGSCRGITNGSCPACEPEPQAVRAGSPIPQGLHMVPFGLTADSATASPVDETETTTKEQREPLGTRRRSSGYWVMASKAGVVRR